MCSVPRCRFDCVALAGWFFTTLILISMSAQTGYGQPVQFTQGTPGSNTMVLKVPLTAYPGRGQDLPITLHYSSRVWRLGFIKSIYYASGVKQSVAEAIYSEFSTAGWTTSLDVPKIEWPKQNDVYWFDGKPYPRGTVYPWTFRVARVYVHMPDGSSHELRKSDQVYQDGGVIDMAGTFYAVDGSRLRYDSTGANTGTLFLPDGTRYVLNGTITQCIDRNGNTLTYNESNRQWTDTMGRVIGMPFPNAPVAGDYNYSVPGYTANFILRFKHLSDVLSPGSSALKPIGDHYLPDPSQEPGDYNSSNFPQPTQLASLFASGYSPFEELPQNFTRVIGRGQVGTSVFNPVVLAEVIYPNNQGYKFFYNTLGEINKVIYPTGGYERYQYGLVAAFEPQQTPYWQATRGITSKWLSANGTGTDEVQWQHSSVLDSGNILNTVTSPDGLKTETRLYRAPSTIKFGYDPTGLAGMVYEERVFAPAAQGGAMLRRNLTQWAVSTSASFNMPPQGSGQYVALRNPRPIRGVSIFLDTGAANALATSNAIGYNTTYQFNVGVEKTLVSEYAFVTVPQTNAQNDPVTSIATGTLLRSIQTTYLTDDANYRSRNILGFPTSSVVKDGSGNIVAQNTTQYDESFYPLITYGAVTGWIDPQTPYRGNPTTLRQWLNVPMTTWLESHTQYDQCGNVKNIWDANNNQAQLDYLDTYKFAYPTKKTSAAPDESGTHAQPTGLESTTVYDFDTGLTTSTTDINGRVTTFEYNDPLRRPTKVTRPDGGWTTTSYNDVPGNLFIRTQVLQHTTPSQQVMESYQYFDQLGRKVRALVNEGSTYLAKDTQYDAFGRLWRVSNPYRTNSLSDPVNPSNEWITNTYDMLSRLQTITTADGAHTDVAFGYSVTGLFGTTITASDQTGKNRKTITDAQGRLRRTIEDSAAGGLNYETNYTYDVMDKLRKIEQGAQLRYFGVDSLGRVIRVRQVEQTVNSNLAWTDPVTGNSGWTSAAVYDALGNITSRTDARNVVTSLVYDKLNRVKTVRYTNDPQNTPGIDNYYDGYRGNVYNEIPDLKGRLWQSETLGQVRFTLDSFDVSGRPKVQKQQFWTGTVWTAPYQTSVTYNLAGQMLTETYPSLNIVRYSYDPAGRLTNLSGNLGGGSERTYANTFEYNPWGGLQQEKFGTQNGLYHKQRHNVRGQLWDVRLSTVSFGSNPADGDRGSIVNYYSNSFTQGGSGTDNNGNLLRQEINVPTSNYFQQNYTYDSLNRLKSVSEKLNGSGADTFKQVFDYDRWGNRTVNFGESSSNVPRPTYTADPNTNRLVAPSGFNYTYDDAGNQTTDNYTGNGQRVYDAQNRAISAQGTGGASQTYQYSGAGLRVRRVVGGIETWQIFGFGSRLIAEYPANGGVTTPQKEYGYRNGQLLLTAEPGSSGGGGGGGSAQNVAWTNGVGVSISGNNLTRTAAGDSWSAGATSSQIITSGDGYAEFTATETNKKRSVGLTSSASVTAFQHISYGMILGDDGQITIHEGAGVYGTFGTYTSGDTLRVAVESGVVKYRKNGTLLRTSTVSPIYPLRAGAALYTNGSTVTNALITSGLHSVIWTNGVGVSISGNNLTRTMAGDSWSAGATSSQVIASGDGYAEFTATETNKRRSVGLTSSASVTAFQHIAYGMILGDDGQITIHEGAGVYGTFGTYTSGDTLRVAVESGVVKYRKNGTLLRTSTVPPTYPLGAGAALYTNGSTVTNATLNSGGGSGGGGVSTAQLRWLVTDQLGTARMIVDDSGNLSGITRHDYLPFGEEIGGAQVALIGGRSSTPGYVSPTIRQRFTGYEYDTETGLNFAQARYQSPSQGRFTSVDPFVGSAVPHNPQTLNRYSYVVNSPFRFVDPTGLALSDIGVIQVDSTGLASKLQLYYDAKAKRAIIAQYATRNGLSLKEEKNGNGTKYTPEKVQYASSTSSALDQLLEVPFYGYYGENGELVWWWGGLYLLKTEHAGTTVAEREPGDPEPEKPDFKGLSLSFAPSGPGLEIALTRSRYGSWFVSITPILSASPFPVGGTVYQGYVFDFLNPPGNQPDRIDSVIAGHSVSVSVVGPTLDLLGGSVNLQDVGFPASGVTLPNGSGTLFSGYGIPPSATIGTPFTFRVKRGH